MDLVAVILFVWSRWLAKQAGAPGWVRFVGVALIVSLFGALGGTLLGLRHAFSSAQNVSAQDKARHVADGIAFAMKFTAAGLVFDLLVLVVLSVVTWRLRKGVRS
ncbi:MAG: MotA/TolQ/ExbB proton channel family protein [Archangium sp.]|nr:MotA/TolQ/ExbB proton channel family protein [Archangium sp.]